MVLSAILTGEGHIHYDQNDQIDSFDQIDQGEEGWQKADHQIEVHPLKALTSIQGAFKHMSVADISHLGNLQPIEPLDMENYADNKESTFQLPPKGRYTLRTRESFPQDALGSTKGGALSIAVDPTIVGPTNEGFNIRFTKVSAKTFKRGAKTASQAGDYLRSCGVKGVKLDDNQAVADAVVETANALFPADLDWRAYNGNTKFAVEGMERFPSDGNGGHLPWYPDPIEFEVDPATGEVKLDSDGNKMPKRLRANVVVSRYVPAE